MYMCDGSIDIVSTMGFWDFSDCDGFFLHFIIAAL